MGSIVDAVLAHFEKDPKQVNSLPVLYGRWLHLQAATSLLCLILFTGCVSIPSVSPSFCLWVMDAGDGITVFWCAIVLGYIS